MGNGDDKDGGVEKTMALDVDDFLSQEQDSGEKTGALDPSELFGDEQEGAAPEKTTAFNPDELFSSPEPAPSAQETTGAMSLDEMRQAGLYEEEPAPAAAAPPPEDDEEEVAESTMMLTAELREELGMSVDAEPEPEPPPPPGLAVERGNDRGRVFDIVGPEVLVGRGLQSNIVLNDATVSRKHFKLVAAGPGYKLVDLGSGNGTKVDGTRVAEIVMRDGMTISVGQTLLVWKAPEAVEAPAATVVSDDDDGAEATVAISVDDFDMDSLSAGRQPAAQATAAPPGDDATRIGEMASMEVDPDWASRAGRQGPEGASATGEGPVPAEAASGGGGKGKLIAIIVAIVVLLGGGAAAVFMFMGDEKKEPPARAEPEKKGSVLDEGWDDDEDEDEGELSLAGRAIEWEAIETAERAVEQGKYTEALGALKRVPSASPDAAHAKLLRKVATAGAAEATLAKIRSLLDKKDYEEAAKVVDSALKADPKDADLKALQKSLTKPEDEKPGGNPADKDIAAALKEYESGEFMGAIDGFDMVTNGDYAAGDKRQAERLALAVTKFETLYLGADRAIEEGDRDKAIKHLVAARKMDVSISGAFAEQINKKLAAQYGAMAQEALGKGDGLYAGIWARLALAHDKDQAAAKAVQETVAGMIDGWIEEAKKTAPESPEKAAELFERAIRVLPEDDERRESSKKLLQQLVSGR